MHFSDEQMRWFACVFVVRMCFELRWRIKRRGSDCTYAQVGMRICEIIDVKSDSLWTNPKWIYTDSHLAKKIITTYVPTGNESTMHARI